MNLERADASYAAWDKAIVAKSRQTVQAVGQAEARVERPADASPAQSSSEAAPSFKSALAFSDDHERDYDVTWRSQAAATGTGPTARDPENEDFGFWDFVDIINPLQHIPVVSTIYRELTGDEISAPARIMGGALYGGPLGFAASIGNAIVEEVTGQDAGEIAMAMVFEDEAGDAGPVLADARGQTAAPAQSNGGAAPEARQLETSATQAGRPPELPTNAGQTAVLQEMSGNAALQDLLKEMGLTASAPGATPAAMLANETAPAKAVRSVPAATQAVSPEVASLQTASRSNAVSGDPQKPLGTDAQVAVPRRSIPIDTSRYINPKAPTAPKPSTVQTETAANSPQVEVARKPTVASAAEPALGNASDKADLQASFADRMLQALDRYQAMNKQKTSLPDVNAAGQPTPRPGAI